MLHTTNLDLPAGSAREALLESATGRFYTGEVIGKQLAEDVFRLDFERRTDDRPLRVIDPFAGDGRLVFWFLECIPVSELGHRRVEVELWDLSPSGFGAARASVRAARARGCRVSLRCREVDAFDEALRCRRRFDVVLTNPPWEQLKPDHRELRSLHPEARTSYLQNLRT